MNQIVHAKYDDIESLAALFAEGFMKDPLYCHYIPYERERPAILLQIFRKYLTDFWDELTVLQTEDGAGAMCICPSEAEGTNRMILPFSLEKVYAQINNVVAPQFYDDFLTLDLLAVKPEKQGKGIGRTLVYAFLKIVGEAKKKGIIEIYNPDHLDFYQKLGFKLAHIQPIGETLSAYLLEG